MSSAEPFHSSYEPDQLMTIDVVFRVAWEMLERQGATDHASLYAQQDRLARIVLDLSLLDHNPTPETARLAVDRFLDR